MAPESNSEHTVALLPKEETAIKKAPRSDGKSHRKITDIQGLRGVAIIAVLLFHIRDDKWPAGYLGVDVFFVISGYLMCMLLSRHQQLDAAKTSDFFFRRIKRIVPVYLFVILAVLLAAIFLFMVPMDYEALFAEVKKPLMFAANIPSEDNEENYFQQSAENRKYFLHLWSLAVEIQFYLWCPLLIFLLNFFHMPVRSLIVFCIGSLSFWYQVHSVNDEEHMSLSGRVWQFMCGFTAYYLGQSGLLYYETWSGDAGKHSLRYRVAYITDQLLILLVTCGLIAMLSVRVFDTKPTSRLVLLQLAVLIVARSGESFVLSNRLLVLVGDISYSVYMIHWPLFEAHKYVDIASYSYRRRVPFTPALLLILTSFLLGYLLEKAYARVSGYIRGWRSLLFVTMLLYCCIFASMNYLEENAENERRLLARVPPALRNIGQIHRDLMDIWRHQDEPEPLNATFTMAYNVQFKELNWKLRSCPQRSKQAVPTTYDFARMDITSTCYQQGKGTKNIVLIGNSHAKTAYYGVEYAFRNLYANLTLFSAHQCTIIGMEQKKNLFTAKKYRTCVEFVKNVDKLLRGFKHSIDIIIVQNAYGLPKDPPVVDWATDPMMREIQQKFGALAEIAREVVFVPRGHFESGISPHLETLQKRVMYNQDLSMFRTPFWFNHDRMWPHLKHRLDHLNCSKCVLVNWEDLWCAKGDGFCDSIDQVRRLSYFFDSNHHNAYGSLHVGRFIRGLYDQWARKQPKNEPPAVINEQPSSEERSDEQPSSAEQPVVPQAIPSPPANAMAVIDAPPASNQTLVVPQPPPAVESSNQTVDRNETAGNETAAVL